MISEKTKVLVCVVHSINETIKDYVQVFDIWIWAQFWLVIWQITDCHVVNNLLFLKVIYLLLYPLNQKQKGDNV